MHSTSHYPMRTRLIPRQRDGGTGCIRAQRPGRQVERHAALREQGVLR